jgi:hypothetical protein
MRGPGGPPPHAGRALPETVHVHREGGRSAGLPEWRTQKTQIQESRVLSVPQAATRAAFEIAGRTSAVPARGLSDPRGTLGPAPLEEEEGRAFRDGS